MERKLPSPQKVNRLYWLEEWSQRRIARRYKCSVHAVQRYMHRHHLKTRRKRRPTADCIVEGCEAPTCQIKRWVKDRVKFIWTIRCAIHHHLWWRKVQTESARRRRRRKGIPRIPLKARNRDYGVELGHLASIAKDGL